MILSKQLNGYKVKHFRAICESFERQWTPLYTVNFLKDIFCFLIGYRDLDWLHQAGVGTSGWKCRISCPDPFQGPPETGGGGERKICHTTYTNADRTFHWQIKKWSWSNVDQFLLKVQYNLVQSKGLVQRKFLNV